MKAEKAATEVMSMMILSWERRGRFAGGRVLDGSFNQLPDGGYCWFAG